MQQQLAEAHAASKAAEARAEEAEIAWEEAKRQVEALKAAAEAAEDHAEALQQLEASLEAASKEKNDLATQLQAAQRDVTLLRDSCRQLESDIAALKAQQAPGKGGLNSPEGASNGEAVTSLDMEALQQAASRSQATHAAQIAELQKQNKELAWQVAMLTRVNPGGAQQTYGRAPPPGAVVVPMPPAFGEEGPRATSFARLTALVLRYRKYLVVVYLVALHALVYFSAVQGTSRCSDTIQ